MVCLMKTSFFLPSALVFLASIAPLPTKAEEKPVVLAVNYPLHYFAERVATDSFELRYLVDEEVDPAFWKPSDEALLAFQRADVILRNGAGYAKWMKNVTLPTTTMVDTSKAFADEFIETEGKKHQHGDGEVHSHGEIAFTTWLDFAQAAEQARAIAERFEDARPGDADEIDRKLDGLLEDLAALDERMRAFGEAWGDEPLFASHPIYQYLARAYGLDIEALEWEPGMDMTDEKLADLEKRKAKHPAAWMIWEDEPTPANAKAVGRLGVEGVVFSPCANRPPEGDWLSVMERNVANLEALPEKK